MKLSFLSLILGTACFVSAQSNNSAAGPVTITQPLQGTTWSVGANETISWTNVQEGISVLLINLLKGDPNALTFVQALATQVDAASGTTQVQVPSNISAGSDYALAIGPDASQLSYIGQLILESNTNTTPPSNSTNNTTTTTTTTTKSHHTRPHHHTTTPINATTTIDAASSTTTDPASDTNSTSTMTTEIISSTVTTDTTSFTISTDTATSTSVTSTSTRHSHSHHSTKKGHHSKHGKKGGKKHHNKHGKKSGKKHHTMHDKKGDKKHHDEQKHNKHQHFNVTRISHNFTTSHTSRSLIPTGIPINNTYYNSFNNSKPTDLRKRGFTSNADHNGMVSSIMLAFLPAAIIVMTGLQ